MTVSDFGNSPILIARTRAHLLCAARRLREQNYRLDDKFAHEHLMLGYWLEFAAPTLSCPIEIYKGEAPDFVVKTGGCTIGFEVTQIDESHSRHLSSMMKKGVIARKPSFVVPYRKLPRQEAEEHLKNPKEIVALFGSDSAIESIEMKSFTKAVKKTVVCKSGILNSKKQFDKIILFIDVQEIKKFHLYGYPYCDDYVFRIRRLIRRWLKRGLLIQFGNGDCLVDCVVVKLSFQSKPVIYSTDARRKFRHNAGRVITPNRIWGYQDREKDGCR